MIVNVMLSLICLLSLYQHANTARLIWFCRLCLLFLFDASNYLANLFFLLVDILSSVWFSFAVACLSLLRLYRRLGERRWNIFTDVRTNFLLEPYKGWEIPKASLIVYETKAK